MGKKAANTKLMARIDEITRNPEQPRTYFDVEALEALGASLKRRQQQPLTVIAFSDPERPRGSGRRTCCAPRRRPLEKGGRR